MAPPRANGLPTALAQLLAAPGCKLDAPAATRVTSHRSKSSKFCVDAMKSSSPIRLWITRSKLGSSLHRQAFKTLGLSGTGDTRGLSPARCTHGAPAEELRKSRLSQLGRRRDQRLLQPQVMNVGVHRGLDPGHQAEEAARRGRQRRERLRADAQLAERCLLYTSPSPRDATLSRMPSSA